MVELSNGGVGGVVESSNGGMVAFSNHRIFELWSWNLVVVVVEVVEL